MIIGKGKEKGNERLVVSGDWVFKMVDQHGLPLEIVVMELEKRNLAFDTFGYINSAHKAGWTNKRILLSLQDSGRVPAPAWEKIKDFVHDNFGS